jgi:glycosyltransferase involved in cell wall biosynthesis
MIRSLLKKLNGSQSSAISKNLLEPLSRPIITTQRSQTEFQTPNLIPQTSTSVPKIGLVYCFFESTLQFNGNTGVQRVARQTARAMASAGIKVVAATWDTEKGSIESLLPKEINHLSKWSGPSPEQWHPWVPPSEAPVNSWLMSNEMPPKLGPGVNGQLLEFAKLNELKTAVTFFDAIPCIFPDLYPAGSAELHYSYMEQLARWDLIFPISMQSAKDMFDLLPESISSELDLNRKLIPLPLPCEFTSAKQNVDPPVSLNARPFILMISTFEQRKNHISLLRAMTIAQRSLPFGFDLILVGHPLETSVVQLVNLYKQILPSMKVVHDASDNQIKEWLDRADFTIFPSVEEGFGLPIVESLWHGKPVICDNQRAINELAKDGGCLQVDVLNVEQLAEAIVTLATDFEVYRSKCKEIENRSFSTWNNYASTIVSLMSQKTKSN